MFCPCSNKIYANIKQHHKTQRHKRYQYEKHWTKVIFEPDAEPYDDYKKLAEKCEEMYLEILINENIDELTIIK